jgi:hypothetical protein
MAAGHTEETIDVERPRGEEQQDDDDQSCYSEDSGTSPSSRSVLTTNSNRRDNGRGDPNGFDIAERETQAVVIWRVIVISAMVLITVGVSIAVFVYVDSKEQSNFETNFEEDAFKIFSDFGKGVIQRFAQLDTLALSMVSYANVSGDSDWPMVTVPNFAVRASKARSSVGAVAVETFHFIPEAEGSEWQNNTRKEWEQYSRENGKKWVTEALAVQQVDDSYEGESLPENVIAVVHNDIWYGDEVMPEDSGP